MIRILCIAMMCTTAATAQIKDTVPVIFHGTLILPRASSDSSSNSGVSTVNGRKGDVTLVKKDVGLDSVNNTADINKPISKAVQDSFNNLSNLFAAKNHTHASGDSTTSGASNGVNSVNGRRGDVTLAKSDVGLDSVNNTADINKPISIPVQNAFTNLTNLFAAKNHRHKASEIDSLISGVSSVNNLKGDVTITKKEVGLDSVNNTADINKPISIAVQEAFTNLSNLFAAKNHIHGAGDSNSLGSNGVKSINGRMGDVILAKRDVGLDSVDNTPDSLKPISNPVKNAFSNLPNLFAANSHRHKAGEIDSLISGVLSVNGRKGDITLTKKDVALDSVNNTPDSLKTISNPVQNAFNNLANIFAAKNHRHNVSDIDGLGGSSDGPIINLAEQTSWKEFRPVSYGTKYSDGSQQAGYNFMGYATFPNVNNSTNRPDVVFQDHGYNSYPNGIKINPLDISTSSRTELYYDIPGLGPSVERHLFEFTDENGKTHRALSYYARRKDGTQGFWNMEGRLALFQPQLGSAEPKQFLSFTDARIDLTATTPGRAVGLFGTNTDGSAVELSTTGGIGKLAFNEIYIDGWGIVRIPLRTFANDAAAKANGLKPGEWYFRNITVSGEVIEVVTRVKPLNL